MTSNIRLTSVDNDAQMDLMLTRLYVFKTYMLSANGNINL